MSDWPQSAPVNLLQASGTVAASVAAATYWWTESGNAIASGSGGSVPVRLLALRASDWSGVASLDLHVSLTTSVTQTGVTFTFGLYPVTMSGGGTSPILTLGTVVPGSTVAFVAPAAAAELPGLSSAFARPADDLYVPGVVISGGSTAVGSRTLWTCTLRGTKS